jgi:hypothetical protein
MTHRAIDDADISDAAIDDFFGPGMVWIECPEIVVPVPPELLDSPERPETPELGPSHLTVLPHGGQEEVQEDLSSIATIDLQQLHQPRNNANIEPTIGGGVIPQHVLDLIWSENPDAAD